MKTTRSASPSPSNPEQLSADPSSCTSSPTRPARRRRGSCRRRGAVPGAGVRRGAPPAGRDRRRPAARRWTRMEGRPPVVDLHARRADARARRCASCAKGRHRLLRPARAAARGGRKGLGPAGRDGAACTAARSTRATSGGSPRSSSRSRTTTASALGLGGADVVLVGVSRTSKTPLSIYLGYLGWKATNVPLVKGIDPPPELFEIDSAQDRRADDRGRAARRDPQRADRADGRRPQLRGPQRDLRGARARRSRSTGGSAAR